MAGLKKRAPYPTLSEEGALWINLWITLEQAAHVTGAIDADALTDSRTDRVHDPE